MWHYEPFTDMAMRLPRGREAAPAAVAATASYSLLHRSLDCVVVEASCSAGVTCRDLWRGVLRIRACQCHRLMHSIVAAPFQARLPAPELFIIRGAESWYDLQKEPGAD